MIPRVPYITFYWLMSWRLDDIANVASCCQSIWKGTKSSVVWPDVLHSEKFKSLLRNELSLAPLNFPIEIVRLWWSFHSYCSRPGIKAKHFISMQTNLERSKRGLQCSPRSSKFAQLWNFISSEEFECSNKCFHNAPWASTTFLKFRSMFSILGRYWLHHPTQLTSNLNLGSKPIFLFELHEELFISSIHFFDFSLGHHDCDSCFIHVVQFVRCPNQFRGWCIWSGGSPLICLM